MMPMFTIRATSEEYAYIKAIADALGESVSAVARDSVFELLDQWRARAKAEQDRLRQLPHGVTDKMAEEAALLLVHDINQRNALHIATGELFGAKSKALYRLLATVWSEKPDKAAQAFLKSIEGRVHEQRGKLDAARPETVPAAPDLETLDQSPMRKTKSYPPRAGKLGRSR